MSAPILDVSVIITSLSERRDTFDCTYSNLSSSRSGRRPTDGIQDSSILHFRWSCVLRVSASKNSTRRAFWPASQLLVCEMPGQSVGKYLQNYLAGKTSHRLRLKRSMLGATSLMVTFVPLHAVGLFCIWIQ